MSKSDPALRRLLKKAFPKQKPPNFQNQKGVSAFNPSLDPDRYYVYKRLLLSSGNHVAVIAISLPVMIGLAFGFGGGTIIPIIALGIALFVGWHLFLWLNYHLTFKGWRKKLGFAVSGWEQLVNREILRCDLCWSTTTIEVETKGNQAALEYIRAALKLFCDRVTKKFYARSTDADDAPSVDPRNNWKITTGLTIQGSANPEVIGFIKKLLCGNLKMINNKFPGAIQSVSLRITEEYQEIDIEVPTTVV